MRSTTSRVHRLSRLKKASAGILLGIAEARKDAESLACAREGRTSAACLELIRQLVYSTISIRVEGALQLIRDVLGNHSHQLSLYSRPLFSDAEIKQLFFYYAAGLHELGADVGALTMLTAILQEDPGNLQAWYLDKQIRSRVTRRFEVVIPDLSPGSILQQLGAALTTGLGSRAAGLTAGPNTRRGMPALSSLLGRQPSRTCMQRPTRRNASCHVIQSFWRYPCGSDLRPADGIFSSTSDGFSSTGIVNGSWDIFVLAALAITIHVQWWLR